MKSLITPHLCSNFGRAVAPHRNSFQRVDVPVQIGTLRDRGAYLVGCRTGVLSRRFADRDRLCLRGEDRTLFRVLCTLRTELRKLGAGFLEPEIELGATATVPADGRCDLLLHPRSTQCTGRSRGIAEIKVVAGCLPDFPDAAALLQTSAYCEMLAVNRKCRIWCAAVCYVSLQESRLRIFFYRFPDALRKVAASLLAN